MTKSQSASRIKKAFHEVMQNEPSTVARAKVSESRKQHMRVAIALNKARAAGAKIPAMPASARPHGSGPYTEEDMRQGYHHLETVPCQS